MNIAARRAVAKLDAMEKTCEAARTAIAKGTLHYGGKLEIMSRRRSDDYENGHETNDLSAFDKRLSTPAEARDVLRQVCDLLGGVDAGAPDAVEAALSSLLQVAGVSADDGAPDETTRNERPRMVDDDFGQLAAEVEAGLQKLNQLTRAQIRICREAGCEPAAFLAVERAFRRPLRRRSA